MRKFLRIAQATALLAFCHNAPAQMMTRVVADNVFIPWELVYGPDKHIWFTQKNGYICRVEPVSRKVDTLYHETNTAVVSESGMMGMVLHPDFANNPHVFVAYNYQQGGMKVRVARYTYSNGTLTTPTTIIDNILGSSIHNGCRLAIVDNKLYITTGDAADLSTPQNLNSVNGKVLRLNLDGTIPTDNPISGNPAWTWGHRNAQGLVYANNRFYSSEHGPTTDDELNILQKGRNYGWPNVHGYCDSSGELQFCADSNVVEPTRAWTPTLAVGGITYYDHPMFPNLAQSILMVTLKDMTMYQLKLNNTFDGITSVNRINAFAGKRMRAICVDPEGRIYVSTSTSSPGGVGAKTDQIIEIYNRETSTSVAGMSEEGLLAVYPNPATEQISVYISPDNKDANSTYTIISVSGKVMQSGLLADGNNNISVSSLAAGLYWLKVSGNSGKISHTKFNKL